MAITNNSQLLSSLTSLIEPNQRQQPKSLRDQQGLGHRQNQPETAKSSRVSQDPERQGRIDANRHALKKLQDRLKADNLEKLKAELSLESIDIQNKAQGTNLNLRESLGSSSKPIDSRPGQIIDIRV